MLTTLTRHLHRWWINANRPPARRRSSRATVPVAAEVLTPRIVLSISNALTELAPAVAASAVNNFDVAASGDFDTSASDRDLYLFFWNHTTGQNRVLNISNPDNPAIDNVISPTAINGNVYTRVVLGEFGGLADHDDFFFWNPQTGENLVVVTTSGGIVSEANVIAPTAVNGNEFQSVVVGNFADLPGEELFFWDHVSGHNRLVSLTAPAIQENAIATAAINGDFQTMVAADFDNTGLDDLFFWNSQTGMNRHITLTQPVVAGPVQALDITTNLIDPLQVNGSVYTQLTIGDWDDNGREDFFFWNPETGQNRVAFVTDPDFTFTFETNRIDPLAVNGDFDSSQNLFVAGDPMGTGDEPAESLFFINPLTGANRRFRTPVS